MANWSGVNFDTSSNERISRVADTERNLRLEALLGVEIEIAGIRLRQITGYDILEFEYAENKLLMGGKPDESDFCHFLWTLRHKSEKKNQKKIFKIVFQQMESVSFLEKVYSLIDSAFHDLPAGGKKVEKSYEANPKVWMMGIIDIIAHEYGWTYDEIMNTPFERTLQLYQYILKRLIGDKYNIRNPLTQKASMAELAKQQNG
jgi:hypothetical protein